MGYAFISGISTAGKSTLAKRISEKTNAVHIDLDELRAEMVLDPNLEPWVNFFWNQDEAHYWSTVSPEQHAQNLIDQSEAFWPSILTKIKQVQSEHESAVFEAVNIFPHLAKRDLDFEGIVLLSPSEEVIFERLQERARWSEDLDMQRTEAEWFFKHENPLYETEAKKYGYPIFYSSENAEKKLLSILNDRNSL